MQQFEPPEHIVIEPDPDVCPDCHGRGWKVVADGGAGAAVRCDCQKRDRTREFFALAGIPERYRRCRLTNFSTANGNAEIRKLLLRAHKISQRYVDRFFDSKQNRFRESGLVYVGVPGTGKTHLAVAVLAELIERYGARGRFVDFTALIHQIQSTFDPSSAESKHQILDPIMRAELLVLDELGAQKPTEWVKDTLYLIMNTRYLQRLPTIFTTNYRLEIKSGNNAFQALAERISPLLVSRLYEMAQLVELPTWDFRREIKAGQHRIGG